MSSSNNVDIDLTGCVTNIYGSLDRRTQLRCEDPFLYLGSLRLCIDWKA